MLKKQLQPPLPPSASRRESPTTTDNHQHAKAIGCMTGILQIISKYQRRRGKFLTFGKKQGKLCASANSKSPAATETLKSSTTAENGSHDNNKKKNKGGGGGGGGEKKCEDVRRSLRDVPRSPTIPSEIRKSSAAPVDSHPEADEAETKRRKLLEALEKCDEDLKLLRKMIVETARSAEHLPLPPIEELANQLPRRISGGGGGLKVSKNAIGVESESEEPSPVSVLDEFVRSQSALSCRHNRQSTAAANAGRMSQQQQRKKPGEEEDIIVNTRFFNEPTTNHDTVLPSMLPTMWSSKAMIESVDEVCKDIAWGEKREVGRIGLALQDNICTDLVQEIVKDLLGDFCKSASISHSLPLQACRRSLRF